MQLTQTAHVMEAAVQAQLRLADPELAALGSELLEVLRPAIRLTLMEVVEMAAQEVNGQLAGQRVEIQLIDGEPELTVRPDQSADPSPTTPSAWGAHRCGGQDHPSTPRISQRTDRRGRRRRRRFGQRLRRRCPPLQGVREGSIQQRQTDDRSVIDRELTVDDSPTIRITIRSGRVNVEGGEPGVVRFRVDTNDPTFEIRQAADAIVASGDRGGRVFVTVGVPPMSDVEIGTASGDVDISPQIGRLDVTTVSGEIEFQDGGATPRPDHQRWDPGQASGR